MMSARRPAAPEGDQAAVAAMRATYVVFIAAGLIFASWASRIPQVKAKLHLDPSALGWLLLCIASGSLLAMPLAGSVVNRFGARRTVSAMAVVVTIGMAVVSIGYNIGVVPVAIGLFIYGMGFGTLDVAMNVQGTIVERCIGRPIMPRFHAGFSLGTVVGALVGAGMIAVHVPVAAHLVGAAAVIVVLIPLAARRFLPDNAADEEATARQPAEDVDTRRLAHWREPRTLLIGLFVLGFAFAEGTGNDWISVAIIEGRHATAAVGTLGYATFLCAMTAGRWVGPAVISRFGRVTATRLLCVVGVGGLILFVFGPGLAGSFPGALLWGFGASLGFPLGMSAGADDPRFAAGRVSVIASIGYCAFLLGPPSVGFLGNHFTVLHALTAVAALLVLSYVIAGAVRPLRRARQTVDVRS
jgi:fucose permease